MASDADSERAGHLKVQRAIALLKETLDELYSPHHTWVFTLQIHGDEIAWWRRDYLEKPIAV